jgi:hypothetical protein
MSTLFAVIVRGRELNTLYNLPFETKGRYAKSVGEANRSQANEIGIAENFAGQQSRYSLACMAWPPIEVSTMQWY